MLTPTVPVSVVPIAPVVQDVPIVITPAIAILAGTELRRCAEIAIGDDYGMGLWTVGDLDIQLARTGDRWRLYLQSMSPVPHITCDQWATAVSAPSVEWQRTPDGCLVWCEWTEPTR